ncbi:MAG TPA: DUF1015 domain-containing protein [Mycobacteriales bacterium]|nr:DUF1015 domain-containing protein [Mycobacteriales bacterium]
MPPAPPVPAGLVLAPFRALRYAPNVPGGPAAVTAPPYDVIDDRRWDLLAAASPANVVRLILPRLTPTDDGQPAGPSAGEDRYAQAAATLRAWRANGWLVPDRDRALYVYEITEAAGHVVRGLLGAVGLTAPDAGVVLPHENTMAGPVADRLALATATEADLEPIFLLYEGGGAASALVRELPDRTQPALDVTDDSGARHRLWPESDPDVLAAVAADLLPRKAVIADGHHRYATYLQHQRACHDAGRGPGPWDAGLALLVDANYGPRVEPIHRIVHGMSLDDAVTRTVGAGVGVRELPPGREGWLAELDAARSSGAGTAFVLADAQRGVLIGPSDGEQIGAAVRTGEDLDRSEAWAALDVTVAHRWLIPQVLGLEDTEANVGYAHDLGEVLAAVETAQRHGGDAVALLLAPTPTSDVLAVAAAGERMPRKSTLFVPKPRSGLVLRAWPDQADPAAAG